MDELCNETNDGDEKHVSRIFEQRKIDEINMKDLSAASRLFRKCVSGKFPPAVEKLNKIDIVQAKLKKKIRHNFTSKKLHDKKLSEIWVTTGRNYRYENLKNDLEELNIKIKVATGRTHVKDHENNFKAIKRTIRDIELIDQQIKRAELEVTHLKSQFPRLTRKKDELSLETESEGDDELFYEIVNSTQESLTYILDKFSDHFLEANRHSDIYEGRVELSRQRESMQVKENQKLRQLLTDMLFDRAAFNLFWSKTVRNLKDRRVFLLDMIERSNQAFSQGADFIESFEKLQSRREADRKFRIAEMVKTERQIDANEIMKVFLGGKGKKREMSPLEPREVRRRKNFKYDYTERLNLYRNIVESIKEFTGIKDVTMIVDDFIVEENNGHQYFNYFHEIKAQIYHMTNNLFDDSKVFLASKYQKNRTLYSFDEQITYLEKTFSEETGKTLEMKSDRDKCESEIAQFLDIIMEILKILLTDLSSIEDLLGDHKNVNVFNMGKFLSILENRLNEVLAFVYSEQRRSIDILTEDPNHAVRSLKRPQIDSVNFKDVITTQQCAECAEGEDVNRYDEEIVYPLDHETIKVNMRKKVEGPLMTYRLHNLSKCNLPHSGVITGRRYVD